MLVVGGGGDDADDDGNDGDNEEDKDDEDDDEILAISLTKHAYNFRHFSLMYSLFPWREWHSVPGS